MRRIKSVLSIVAVTVAVMLPMNPALACACGVPDWSVMSDEEIVSTINAAEAVPRIMAGQGGKLPPAPAGYQYAEDYALVPLPV